MPKVSFYLRNEDVEAWKAIDKKTAWVHEHLTTRLFPKTAMLKGFSNVPDGTVVNLRAPIPPTDFNDKNYCEHGQLKGQCLQKKCKYGRGA